MKKIKSNSYTNRIKSAAGDKDFRDNLKVGDRVKVLVIMGLLPLPFIGTIVSVGPKVMIPTRDGGEEESAPLKVKLDGGEVISVFDKEIIGLASE